jgi:hypothetical protein
VLFPPIPIDILSVGLAAIPIFLVVEVVFTFIAILLIASTEEVIFGVGVDVGVERVWVEERMVVEDTGYVSKG